MAYALVANVSEPSVSGTEVTTAAIDTTGADLLIIWLSSQSNQTEAPTDSKSNTWTPLTAEVADGGERGQFYYAINPTVGTGHTFTCNRDLCSIYVAAFSGADTTAPGDQENGAQTFGSTLSTGSITPSEDNCLVVAGIAFNVAGTMSIGSSFSIIDQETKTANNQGGALAYLIQTTAAAVNPQWTHSPGSSSMAARIASFKPAGGAPADPEGGLVGGKLIRGGLLLGGALVR